MTLDFLLCINCGKKVADVKGEIDGVTTWFPVCSECLFNVKGWTRADFEKMKKKKPNFEADIKRGLKEFPKVAEDFKKIEQKTKKMQYCKCGDALVGVTGQLRCGKTHKDMCWICESLLEGKHE